jgi:hypothetical protein
MAQQDVPDAEMAQDLIGCEPTLVGRTCALSVVRHYEVPHDRIDLGFPLPAREHAVMADAGLQMVAFPEGGQLRAEIVGCNRLAHRADVIALSLNRQEGGPPDGAEIERLAAVLELVAAKIIVLEH